MASLNFKGKSAVWNHHLSVPYHTLEKVESNSLDGENASENLLIEWDNLLALKALLPKYQGQVKCIYIDPPYNTGKEGWAYNDNVSSPIIKEWLGKVIDKEDMTRHDKWLCMMTPRIKLLRELLAEDGIIFISIDDNEVSNAKILLDEIFLPTNFLANLVWANKEWGGSSDSKNFRIKHEYVLVYAKNIELANISGVWITNESRYTQRDQHFEARGPYYPQKLWMWSIQYSESLDYPIETPNWKTVMPSENNKWKRACWRWGKTKYKWGLENDFIEFKEDKNWIWQVYTKQYLNCDNEWNLIERSSRPFWVIDEYSSTQASKSLAELFWNTVFSYPKPVELIKYLISLVSSNDDIILDSFAWSGTTAQAIMELNQEDGGNRKFILVQLPETLTEKMQAKAAWYDFVHEITRDRIKKVVEKYDLAIGFTYYNLGPSIEWRKILEWESLPSWESFAKYVHFLATGKPIDDIADPDATWEICTEDRNTGVYLIYADTIEELRNLAITRDWLESVKSTEGKKIVYAPACFLDKEVLDDNHISFVQVPYNLFQRK